MPGHDNSILSSHIEHKINKKDYFVMPHVYKRMYMWLVNVSEKKTSLRLRPCGLYCTSYNAELNTCLIGYVFICKVEDKELWKKKNRTI